MVALQERQSDNPQNRNDLGYDIIPSEIRPILDSTRALKRPSQWLRKEISGLSLRDKVNEYVTDISLRATASLSKLIDTGWGRDRYGDTQGRENEDNTIGIDLISEQHEAELTVKYSKRYGINIAVLSEHNDLIPDGRPDTVEFRDPTENSWEFEAGHGSTNQYFTGGQFMEQDGKWEAVSAFCANLQTKHININRDGKNYSYNPNTGDLKELPLPKKIYSIKDPDFRPVSYDGKWKYTEPFRNNFGKIDRDRDQRQGFHGKAGSHLYGDGIATGSVSAYIMFNEPVGEIAQGIAFARDADYVMASVDPETGKWEEYKVDVDYYLKNPDKYKEDRVKLFVVASTRELLEEIIFYGFSKNFDSPVFRDTSPVGFASEEGDATMQEQIKVLEKPSSVELAEGKTAYLPGFEDLQSKKRRSKLSVVK